MCSGSQMYKHIIATQCVKWTEKNVLGDKELSGGIISFVKLGVKG